LLGFGGTLDELRLAARLRFGQYRPDGGSLAISMTEDMSPEDRRALEREVERLREEHRDLDAAISALTELGIPDQLQLQRLKKRKLVLRDRIAYLDDQTTPDIIA
jgi:hypothetical protein